MTISCSKLQRCPTSHFLRTRSRRALRDRRPLLRQMGRRIEVVGDGGTSNAGIQALQSRGLPTHPATNNTKGTTILFWLIGGTSQCPSIHPSSSCDSWDHVQPLIPRVEQASWRCFVQSRMICTIVYLLCVYLNPHSLPPSLPPSGMQSYTYIVHYWI